jgi:hypothetical protein
MSTTASPARRRLVAIGAVIAFAVAGAACGSDDPAPELPEGGTGSAFNDAIITSESHDEVLLDGGQGEMLVAVDCDPQTGGNVVTVVAEGLAPAVYIGEFEPTTGVTLSLDASGGSQAVGASQMTLDAEEYTVTFADIDGAVFNLMGCPS